MGKVVTGGLWVLAVVLFLSAAGFIFISYIEEQYESGETAAEEDAADGETESEGSIKVITESEEDFEVSDEVTVEGLPSELQFSNNLHHMTHQKVEASKKWRHLEITDERLENMHSTAQESDYEYRDFYIKVLENWQNDDFSNAVEVHNFIWNARNGTVGRATGPLTEKEEMDYKIRHFE
ncbi:DUF6241 domain-containing protein [Salinicoccus sp. HZC-1]|uniref:DUF6241 domain-containing protein n=1 Tax=Salinicoccus sp. HZC-1 TaxID=3385497 RepID=UPI00398AD501